jgi:hypothetical protein
MVGGSSEYIGTNTGEQVSIDITKYNRGVRRIKEIR